MAEQITVQTMVAAPVAHVWTAYTSPNHITQWNFAHESWCCPSASVDLQTGGRYVARMEARDGSMGFDLEGTIHTVTPGSLFEMTLSDGRKVCTTFLVEGDRTQVITVFDAETENSVEMQKDGWQAILDNFRRYVEQTPSDRGARI